ncbi:hypothetical protein [Nannocystis sp.]|uniref:hypothetical protein n=1 Tax=Nannocystis sp. TaxID=1962667 RepID=UPI0025DC0B18|nr:hypothetical protein [Nannocystis sp.]MBK7826725.1 hypothetical protein [Nannocystis sp.]
MPRPRLLWWPTPAIVLGACLSSGTDPGAAPVPAASAQVAAPARPAAQPVAPDPALLALRAEHPQLLNLDPARDRDGWFTMARLLADKDSLGKHYRRVDYEPPAFSRALVVTVRPGVGQPRYFHYSLGDTAFEVPRHYFHPASTVKLATSVGALWTLGALGLTGDAEIEFSDAEGLQSGQVADMVHEALMHSSNKDYNRLVRIAGFDALNQEYLSPRWGLPEMAIQARYGNRDGPTLRSSPPMRYREGELQGELPAREASGRHASCKGNCATLFELHDVQRRVMLHEELPADQRFPISLTDVERMRATMKITRKRLGRVPDEAFGAPVEVFNNVGRIPRVALLENATLVERGGPRRLFMVASVAFPGALGDTDRLVVPRLRALVRPTLDLALQAAPQGPGLQHDAGPRPGLRVAQHAQDPGRLLVEVEADAEARVWLDRRPFTPALGRAFTITGVAPGEHVIVVELGPVAAPTAYRASLVTVARVATSMQAAAPLR